MSEAHWWLESGPETCQFRLRTFHYEAGYHCIDCDRPICPACVAERLESRETLCPECHEDATQRSQHTHEREEG
ncbi:hypothetical protein [Halomonas chromatireducens]|uniref:Uncharacterized protein n=1 Tax=Halomonas chromatireducens TaxID=507626 RepID=A0A0X8HBT5_9GAMM|nr:hypothetical protein [Halomonas chromatireducens]AMC99741.1 hypothetical protein LOKO_00655 [Halomonas chromatireducens]